ncbi:hypothetical protein [Flavobacterium aquidurense]|uniref:Uncharacterized protein n=1 Tax=Flavobacterium aquidurense TaxID=362413 RepID=A0A0Q0RYY0_9FLAO|nr:hypothetical protein [Flavobacterium aquidurense]KQB37697.1 hypothetical protein RC62_2863 [Flavobacterium aquidurense]
MKITTLLYSLLFFQITVSQNKNEHKKFIEVEIINKHHIDSNDKSYSASHESPAYMNSYSSGYNKVVSKNKIIMIFDLDGKILQRKGFQIKKKPQSKPQDLIEVYNYDKNGFLSSITEQEKINNSFIEKTFLQQFYYNDKNQLIGKTFLDLKKNTITKRIVFEYDSNRNNTKIISDSLHYIIKQYDTNNQIISSTVYNDKKIHYAIDEEVKKGNSYYDDNNKIKVLNFAYKKQYYPDGLLKEIEQSNDFDTLKRNKKYAYFSNGLLKNEETSYSYYPNNYLLQQTFSIKSDFRENINRKAIEDINRQLLKSDIWE